MKTKPKQFVVERSALYVCDDGAILCGAHLGWTAETTGRDISGQRVVKMGDSFVREFTEIVKSAPRCERCGLEHTFAK